MKYKLIGIPILVFLLYIIFVFGEKLGGLYGKEPLLVVILTLILSVPIYYLGKKLGRKLVRILNKNI